MAEPISIQQLKDASLDVKSLEEVVNGDENVVVTTRLGETYPSVKSVLENIISVLGYILVDSFELGATLTQRNQALRHAEDGKLYRWGGSLPKTVAASSTPASSGGFGTDAWVEVSDASLAQRLAGLGGASLIKDGVSVFNNLSEFNASASKVQKNSKVYLRQVYQNNDLEGEGRVYSFVTNKSANAVNIATTGGFLTRPYDGKVFVSEFGCKPDDNTLLIYSTNSTALQKAFDLIRYYDGGVLSMGNNCIYPIGTDDTEGASLKDTVYGNVSNFDWQFNRSVINMRYFRIAWHPTAKEYGNHKNITISDAVYFGDSSNVSSGGTVISVCQQDFVHVDDLTVTGCTFIEANGGGHVFDLMGCRHVTIDGNEFLGSGVTNRLFAEAVQVSQSTVAGAGNPIKSGGREFFADLPTTHVYFKNNTCKPFKNATSGLTTYPARPIGDHALNAASDIYVQNNYIEDVVVLDVGDSYPHYILSISGIHNLHVNDNVIISNNGNFNIIKFTTYNGLSGAGDTKTLPSFSFSGNTVKVSNLAKTTTARYAAAIDFRFTEYGDETITKGIGFKADFSENIINYDATSAEDGIVNSIDIMFFRAGLKNVNINANNNTFDTLGSVRSHIITDRPVGRIGGRFEYCGNTFKGHISGRALDHKYSTGVVNGEGSEVIAENNTFIKQWLGVSLDTEGLLLYKNNKHIGFEAVSPSGEAGSGNTILLSKGYPIVAQGNILINETRLTPVKIVSSTDVRPESEFLIKNNV